MKPRLRCQHAFSEECGWGFVADLSVLRWAAVAQGDASGGISLSSGGEHMPGGAAGVLHRTPATSRVLPPQKGKAVLLRSPAVPSQMLSVHVQTACANTHISFSHIS